jgi:hypothetical protein
MRETVGSLRAYFIVVSILGIVVTALSARLIVALLPLLAQIPRGAVLTLIISTVGDAALSIVLLYTGIRLPVLLRSSPRFVVRVLYVLAAWLIIAFLFSLPSGVSVLGIIHLVVGLLIAWYLWRNVLRLANPS